MTLDAMEGFPKTIAPIDEFNARSIRHFLMVVLRLDKELLWFDLECDPPRFKWNLQQPPGLPGSKVATVYAGGICHMGEDFKFLVLAIVLLAQQGIEPPANLGRPWARSVALSMEPDHWTFMRAALQVLIFQGSEVQNAPELITRMIDEGELTLPVVIKMYELAETRPQGDLLQLIQDAFAGPPTAPFEPSSS